MLENYTQQVKKVIRVNQCFSHKHSNEYGVLPETEKFEK